MSNVSLFGAEFCSLHAMENTEYSGYILKAVLILQKMARKQQQQKNDVRLSSNRQGLENCVMFTQFIDVMYYLFWALYSKTIVL